MCGSECGGVCDCVSGVCVGVSECVTVSVETCGDIERVLI